VNLVDDRAFTKPLIKSLRGHVDAFAESMATVRGRAVGAPDALAAARPAAVAWVYSTVLVAWAEDHQLIDPWLRADAEPLRKEFLGLPGMTMSAWAARAIASLCCHPATWCLLDPRYNPLREARPSEQAVRDLVDWWSTDAPSLAYDVEKGPGSLSGWLPGDLLGALSDERRKGFAFVQTPWWVADFILDLTLVPAAGEFRDITLRTIDPCCGTGHFLIRKIDYLWELYTTGRLSARQKAGEPVTGWAPVSPAEAITRIIAGVHGCEKDPLTAAVARLRFVVAIGDLMHRAGLIDGPLRLDRIPPFQPPIAVGDSLLAGKISRQGYADLHPKLAAIENLGYDEQVNA
jgi:hypothetical protein